MKIAPVHSRSKCRRATSLVESMVLMVILSIIVLGTGVAFQSLVDVPTNNNRTLTITNLLVDKMERLKALGFTALSATANGSDSPVVDNKTYTRTWTITVNPGGAYDANFLQYSVTIGSQTVTLSDVQTMNNNLQNKRRRAMTLAELMIGLAVLAILSVGATNFIIGGLHIDRALLDANRQVSEMELAIRRMTHNIRTGTVLSITGTTSFTIQSQPDAGNAGATYTIVYTYDSSAKTLSESSTQYGATPPVNIIAYNVSAFSVSQVSSGPTVLAIDMTIAAATNAAATRRTFQVCNRNS